MTKGTRSLVRVSAIAVPMFVALVAASCGGGSISDVGTPTGTGATGTGGNSAAGGAAATSSDTSTATGAGGNGGTGGVIDPKCTVDADCANDPKGKVCDAATGSCVGCTPTNDVCAQGLFCDPSSNTCKIGCTDNTDCASGSSDVFCDTATNTCAGCIVDTDCPLGSVCFQANKTCTPGCSAAQACQPGLSCCGGTCFDVNTTVNHCGDCSTSCTIPNHAAPTCVDGMCGMGACDAAYANCDSLSTNGCEQNILQDGACSCVPGTTQSCYQGGPNTQGVGPCKAGTQTCNADGTSWSACGGGQVLPKSEICSNQVDDDCDGTIDNVVDSDGDGWTTCNGDCNDTNALVNPGAFEVVGNGIDDDCDATSSDTTPAPPAAPR